MIANGEKALVLPPNGAEVHVGSGYFLNYAGKPEETMPYFEKAIRLNPVPPSFCYDKLGGTYRMIGRHEDALAEYGKQFRSSLIVCLLLLIRQQFLACWVVRIIP
jgi:tetratricopeptide (TPR) repeat protein